MKRNLEKEESGMFKYYPHYKEVEFWIDYYIKVGHYEIAKVIMKNWKNKYRKYLIEEKVARFLAVQLKREFGNV